MNSYDDLSSKQAWLVMGLTTGFNACDPSLVSWTAPRGDGSIVVEYPINGLLTRWRIDVAGAVTEGETRLEIR